MHCIHRCCMFTNAQLLHIYYACYFGYSMLYDTIWFQRSVIINETYFIESRYAHKAHS